MGHGAKVATSLLVARTSPTLCCTPYRSECLTPRRRPLCMIVTATTAGSAAFRSFANRFASASGSFIPQPRFGAAETKTSMQHYSACGRNTTTCFRTPGGAPTSFSTSSSPVRRATTGACSTRSKRRPFRIRSHGNLGAAHGMGSNGCYMPHLPGVKVRPKNRLQPTAADRRSIA